MFGGGRPEGVFAGAAVGGAFGDAAPGIGTAPGAWLRTLRRRSISSVHSFILAVSADEGGVGTGASAVPGTATGNVCGSIAGPAEAIFGIRITSRSGRPW